MYNTYCICSHEITWGTGSGQQSITSVGRDLDDANSMWVVKAGHGKQCTRGEPIRCNSVIRLGIYMKISIYDVLCYICRCIYYYVCDVCSLIIFLTSLISNLRNRECILIICLSVRFSYIIAS